PHAGGTLRVVGRTRISPRHTVYLLGVGDRVLIVGTGPQGAPSLLGELTGSDALERLNPAAEPPSRPRSVTVNWRPPAGDARWEGQQPQSGWRGWSWSSPPRHPWPRRPPSHRASRPRSTECRATPGRPPRRRRSRSRHRRST